MNIIVAPPMLGRGKPSDAIVFRDISRYHGCGQSGRPRSRGPIVERAADSAGRGRVLSDAGAEGFSHAIFPLGI